jgi:hypothetical protein
MTVYREAINIWHARHQSITLQLASFTVGMCAFSEFQIYD